MQVSRSRYPSWDLFEA